MLKAGDALPGAMGGLEFGADEPPNRTRNEERPKQGHEPREGEDGQAE